MAFSKSGIQPPNCAADKSFLAKPCNHGVSGQFTGTQRQQHAGGIDGIDETVSVADQHPPITHMLGCGIGEFFGHVQAGDAGCVGDPLAHHRTGVNVLLKNLVRLGLRL